jgi:hypothetical protein
MTALHARVTLPRTFLAGILIGLTVVMIFFLA